MPLVKYKDQISSIGAIATSLGVIMALTVAVVDLTKTKRPDLQLSYSETVGNSKTFFVYNAGDAPCVDFHISYEDRFIGVRHIVNYETANIVNAKVSFDTVSMPAKASYSIGNCSESSCEIQIGYLPIEKLFALELKIPVDSAISAGQTSNFTASCTVHSESIEVPIHA
ncbi:hypothetical protein ACL7TT_15420 [Microbulbifer sp. 2304DJ12-6]|uniref:hypothetical protein n=1 Tax=Microbulbifer sp. 2304DJ12-6 TaxID=3233340 RepID=UPI0039B0D2DD